MAGLFRSVAMAAVAALVVTFPFHATAQDYPARPITLIVPFPAGGPTDLALRALAEAAAKHLGQPVIVENKAGGAGTVGPATMAATGKPDGYTIAQMPVTVYRLPLMQDTTWKADDFTYIIHLTGYVFAHIAAADTPFKTWKDVVEYAKKNPGQGDVRLVRHRRLAASRHRADRREGRHQADACAVQGRRRTACRGRRRPRHGRRRRRLVEADRRRRQGALPQRLDRAAAEVVPRRSDADGARLSVRDRLAVRHRRPEGHGPEDRREAARRLQEGDRGARK